MFPSTICFAFQHVFSKQSFFATIFVIERDGLSLVNSNLMIDQQKQA